MSRYVPARHYISFGIVALALAGFCRLAGLFRVDSCILPRCTVSSDRLNVAGAGVSARD